ncbi:MAG: sigma-70 family RNA polymerase sigma factor [Acidobacteriota bacterium]|nr:sigma-70 family RNA polymerase sigma factor [Acidobacteriota bacterium]
MLLAARGDEVSFSRLYEIFSPVVFGLSLRILGNTPAAEEAVVDVFSEIWRQPPQLDGACGSPLLWITTLTRTRALERRRASGNVVSMATAPAPVPPPVEGANPEPWGSQESRRARAALEGLPSDLRRVLEMACFEGLAPDEIATRLALSSETVRQRIRRGMSGFREALGSLHPEDRPHG